MAESLLKRLGDAVARADLHRRHGRVSDLIGLIVEAERRVRRGGCVVRTPEGDVDAGIDTKLARAREVVEQELGKAATTPAAS